MIARSHRALIVAHEKIAIQSVDSHMALLPQQFSGLFLTCLERFVSL
jgi:hypothetical protein